MFLDSVQCNTYLYMTRTTRYILGVGLVLFGLTMSLHSVGAEPSNDAINTMTGQIEAVEKPAFGEENMEEAKRIFRQRCTRCHGKIGNGRGSLASQLSPRPTDLTNPYWYQTTTPKKLKRVILGGGGAIGKSILMPANPDLRNKPRVVAALIQYIIKLVPRKSE